MKPSFWGCYQRCGRRKRLSYFRGIVFYALYVSYSDNPPQRFSHFVFFFCIAGHDLFLLIDSTSAIPSHNAFWSFFIAKWRFHHSKDPKAITSVSVKKMMRCYPCCIIKPSFFARRTSFTSLACDIWQHGVFVYTSVAKSMASMSWSPRACTSLVCEFHEAN